MKLLVWIGVAMMVCWGVLWFGIKLGLKPLLDLHEPSRSFPPILGLSISLDRTRIGHEIVA